MLNRILAFFKEKKNCSNIVCPYNKDSKCYDNAQCVKKYKNKRK
jgi:hypothetical protein